MAINKVVNKSTKTHAALRNVLEYVLRTEKVKDRYITLTGPYDGDNISYDAVYQSFLKEKRIWNKDRGRMYSHNILSFHKDESVTPKQAEEIGRIFAEEFFPGHQSLIAVHQDKDHLHIHIITNSVSFLDGSKLHQTKKDLERQKEFTNTLCCSMGLSLTEKGKHFDGSAIEEGRVISWNKDKYNLIADTSKQSYVADCAIAVAESIAGSICKEDFIRKMKVRGWNVSWSDRRKHIVFSDVEGRKVRDSNISRTFTMSISKEALTDEFRRQAELRRCSTEAESVISGYDTPSAVRGDTTFARLSGMDSARITDIKKERKARGH